LLNYNSLRKQWQILNLQCILYDEFYDLVFFYRIVYHIHRVEKNSEQSFL